MPAQSTPKIRRVITRELTLRTARSSNVQRPFFSLTPNAVPEPLMVISLPFGWLSRHDPGFWSEWSEVK